MRYTVVWHPLALEQLASLWMDASNRNAVAKASDEVDRRLAVDPLNEGESREHLIRIFFVGPLAVRYFVSPVDRIVYVLSVWCPKPRKRP